MLRVAQQVAALSFLGSFTLKLRWLPSELNVSDGPSRGQILPGPFQCGSEHTNQQGPLQSGVEVLPSHEGQVHGDEGFELRHDCEGSEFTGHEESLACGD